MSGGNDHRSAAGGGDTYQVDGNRLDVLDRGEQQFDALLRLIDDAERSLRLLYYIYADDRSGRIVRDRLEAASGRGVDVRLIVDGFGSAVDEGYFARLTAAGATVRRFHPRFGRRYLLRNHQKMALADAETDRAAIIVGGFNIEDDYFRAAEDGAWRDLALRVEGPAAARLAGYYDALLDWIGGRRATIRALLRKLHRWSRDDGAVRWLFGGPTRYLSPWARAIEQELRRARRFWMIAAYFVPGPFMLRRIERAAMRGDARLITAGKSDNGTTIAASRFLYKGLLRKKVRVLEYQPTKLHTKLFVIDDAVHVGSANFDMRSLYLNLELMLRVEDKAFADRMRGYFEGEAAQSREVHLAEVTGWRTAAMRLRWATAYLLVGVLDHTITRRLNFGEDGSEL